MVLAQYSKTIDLLLLVIFFHVSFGKAEPGLILFSATDEGKNTKKITITFIIPEKDFIYKDFITCSVHEPTVTLSDWKADKQSISRYDSAFKATKQIFNKTFSISMTATTQAKYNDTIHLYCTYYRKSEKKINHTLFTFNFPQSEQTVSELYELPKGIEKQTAFYHQQRSPIDLHIAYMLNLMHKSIEHFKYYAHLYFFILIFIIFFFLMLSHYFKEQLALYHTTNEIVSFLISFLLIIAIIHIHIRLTTVSSLQTIFSLGWVCASCFGVFYIKKSTQIQSRSLRTLCTLLGILLTAGALLLFFKAIQF